MSRGYHRLLILVASVVGLPLWASAQDEPAAAPVSEEAFVQQLTEASTALQRDQLQLAERHFREALRMRPGSREARFGIGTLFIKQGRYARAIEVMEGLMDEYPDEFSIINNLAWLYATSTDHTVRDGERAVLLARKALLLQPNNYHVWSTLSEGHYVSGDYDRALRAAQEAVRLSKQAGARRDVLEQYERQVERSRLASDALSILE